MRLQIYKLFLTNGLVFPRFYNIFAALTRRSIAFSITEGPGRKFLPHPQDATSITTRPSLPDATSPDGGIGRRAGLKHQWSNPCRFDPGSGYTQMQVLDFQTLAFFFFLFAPRLHHRKFYRLPESCRVSSASFQENCSRFPLFPGYQEQFHYVFALGR